MPSNISNSLQYLLGAKEQPQPGLAGQLLAMRGQPSWQDVEQSAQARLGGQNISAQGVADQRMSQSLGRLESLAKVQKFQQDLSFPDVDKLGDLAFMRIAQGLPITDEMRAAALIKDAQSTGLAVNPATGDFYNKPRLSDRIPIPGVAAELGGGVQARVPVRPSGPVNPVIVPDDTSSPPTTFGPENPVNGGPKIPVTPMTTRTRMDLAKENIQTDKKRVDEIAAMATSSGAAAASAERMRQLLPDLGHTGTGGATLGAIDKALTAVGGGDLIAGDPASRETFAKEGVDAWVAAVTPLKGALSNVEGTRFDRAISNLSTTGPGIEMRARIAKALSDRAQEKSQFYQEWFYQNGSLRGADEVWEDYASKNQVITDDMIKRDGQGGSANAPSGSKLIGTSGGKKIYQLPDGSHVMEE